MKDKTLYRKYTHMKGRCYNPNDRSYKDYGARGIAICDEWLDSYEAFESWSLSHGYEQGLAIDRIDNNGPYSPDNCRFVTLSENNQNRRSTHYYTIDGVTKNLQQWCDYYGIKRGTVVERLKRDPDIKKALTKPLKKYRDRNELVGKTFGRLTVVRYAGDENIGKDHNMRWVCECECGEIVIVPSHKLKSGHTRSCGCLQREKATRRMMNDNPMKKQTTKKRQVKNG